MKLWIKIYCEITSFVVSFVFTTFVVNDMSRITYKLWLCVLDYLEKCSNLIIDFLILSVCFSLASACSHVVAALYKLEAYFRMGTHKVASTSKLVNGRYLLNKLHRFPCRKLILADQSRQTHFQKILMMATVLRLTSEEISQVKNWHMSNNKNWKILSYWFPRVPYSLV